jgi:hypothetical protein
MSGYKIYAPVPRERWAKYCVLTNLTWPEVLQFVVVSNGIDELEVVEWHDHDIYIYRDGETIISGYQGGFLSAQLEAMRLLGVKL